MAFIRARVRGRKKPSDQSEYTDAISRLLEDHTMPMQDDPLQDAQANAERMAIHIEQGLSSLDPEDVHSHAQDAIRFGEQSRSFLEEALDSTEDERIIMYGEQALDSLEEALDQANQALFASEASVREHMESLGTYGEQVLANLGMALGVEAM
jgi:hypothetical protein